MGSKSIELLTLTLFHRTLHHDSALMRFSRIHSNSREKFNSTLPLLIYYWKTESKISLKRIYRLRIGLEVTENHHSATQDSKYMRY